MGVFASDQHKPLVRYERSEPVNDSPFEQTPGANPPMALSDPEVMELEVDPTMEPDPPDDWRTLYINYLLHNALPATKTEARWLTCRAKSFVLVEGELYK